MTDRPAWFTGNPDLLEAELAHLKQSGWSITPNEQARDEEDRIELELRRDDGPVTALIVQFADQHPKFRPVVKAPQLRLPRHQHPFRHELCLIAQDTSNWDPDTLIADHLDSQLQKVVAAASPRDDGVEVPLAEPRSTYLPHLPHQSVLLPSDDWPLIAAAGSGTFTAVVTGLERDHERFAGTFTIIEVRDRAENVLYEAEPQLVEVFGTQRLSILGTWATIDDLPPEHARGLAQHLRSRVPQLPRARRVGSLAGLDVELSLALYTDEINHRTEGTDAVAVLRSVTGQSLSPAGQCAYVRVYRAGPEHRSQRAPELITLGTRSVLQFGLGSLGAPVALELARAGIGAWTGVDSDAVDPSGSIRHPVSPFAAGRSKVEAVARLVRAQNPYVAVAGYPIHVGRRGQGETRRQDLRIAELIRDHDLVLDTTAQVGVGEALVELCAEVGVPYVAASATFGGWGGRVLRLMPDQCYGCYVAMTHDPAALPRPAEDPDATVEPTGSCTLTFTAAGFDLTPLVGQTARIVASTLLADLDDAYPALPHDVATLALRDEDGRPTLPVWHGTTLERRHDCRLAHRH